MNKTVLLTGAASGIGKALTEALYRQGFRLMATDINAEGLQALADRLEADPARLQCFAFDVAEEAGWEAALAQALNRLGAVDILLNVAAYLKPGYLHETTAGEIHRHMDVNAKGLMLGCQVLGRHMVARGSGHIINIASLAGVAPVPGISLYSTSKFAVRGFSLAIAQELKRHNVYVTVVCPDAVQTPMLDLQLDYEEAALTFSGPRALEVREVVEVILRRAIPRRPLEITLPASRGYTAKIASFFPALVHQLSASLSRRGRQRQQRLQQQNRDGASS